MLTNQQIIVAEKDINNVYYKMINSSRSSKSETANKMEQIIAWDAVLIKNK